MKTAKITELDCNGFNYKVNYENPNNPVFCNITHNIGDTPNTLYKYYPLKSYNIEAITTPYLYANHPTEFNDQMDSDKDLINYLNVPLSSFKYHLCTEIPMFGGPIHPESWVNEMFDKDKIFLSRALGEIMFNRIFKKLGIISLCNSPENILMWSYYADNKGFVVKYRVDKLIESFRLNRKKLEFIGLYPINYVERLTQISFSDYDFGLCYYYVTNIKQNLWKEENEWRMLVYNPLGNFHPYYNGSDIDSRKCRYNIECIDEIILGYNFFHTLELDYDDRKPEYHIYNMIINDSVVTDRGLRSKLLDFIIEKNISCKQILKDSNSFILIPLSIRIEKLDEYKYKVNNIYLNQ